MHPVVSTEVQDAVELDEPAGSGAERPRIDVFHQPCAVQTTIGAPQLHADVLAAGGEEHGIPDGIERQGVASVCVRYQVSGEHSALRGAVRLPQLATVNRVPGREVDSIPQRYEAAGVGVCAMRRGVEIRDHMDVGLVGVYVSRSRRKRQSQNARRHLHRTLVAALLEKRLAASTTSKRL